jgi:hypothetical protein
MTKDNRKTQIYDIYSYLGDKIYIGAKTYEFVSQRMAKYRSDYQQFKNNKTGSFTTSFILFEEYGVENYY